MPWHMVREHIRAGRLKHLQIGQSEGLTMAIHVVRRRDTRLGPTSRWLIEDVRKRLLPGRTQDEADVRARHRQQPSNGIGHRPVVAATVQLVQDAESVGNRGQVGGRFGGEREIPPGIPAELPRGRRLFVFHPRPWDEGTYHGVARLASKWN